MGKKPLLPLFSTMKTSFYFLHDNLKLCLFMRYVFIVSPPY